MIDLITLDPAPISGEQWLGMNIFFYVFLPSLIIMGIWSVLHDLKRDQDWERGGASFANDFTSHETLTPAEMPRFPGWHEVVYKKDQPGRLIAHMEQYGPK